MKGGDVRFDERVKLATGLEGRQTPVPKLL